MQKTEMLKKSIIVAAHPDDEALWFSSILDKVDNVVLCFLDQQSRPQWTIGRKQSLSEYPMKNISCLRINQSETFNGADWNSVNITKFGIEISNKKISDKEYKENYYELKNKLESKLIGYRNVFTHNPWGEYGHEEHIQIYRVIKELQKDMNFNLWFSNYCSNKSFNLMLRYISGCDSEYVTLGTNKVLGEQIKELYKRNTCWTWYDDWEWFNEESFIKDISKNFKEGIKKYGHIFSLNMIKVELSENPSIVFRIFRKLSCMIAKNKDGNN